MQNLVSAQWLSYLGKIEQLQLGIRMAFGYINKVFDFAWQQHAISNDFVVQTYPMNEKKTEKKKKLKFLSITWRDRVVEDSDHHDEGDDEDEFVRVNALC